MAKNTIMSSKYRIIKFVGKTFPGRTHDYTMLKKEFPPEVPWFKDVSVLADLGYQGIRKDYAGEKIRIPHKKSPKSKKNPAPELSKNQKKENRELSKKRIFVENAIGGMKRFNILNHKFRNKKKGLNDDIVVLCAGLWNLLITA